MLEILAIALAALAASAAGQAPPARPIPLDASWSASSVWDDGQAEVAQYESHRVVYGADRLFETTVITVKEEFDLDLRVKAEPPFEGREVETVLKMNVIARIPTDNYPYSYMASVFVRRADPLALVKMAVSSQEWCGTTYKMVVPRDGSAKLEFHSYVDGQGDGAYPISLEGDALLEEQMLLVARSADPAPGRSYAIALHDSLITNTAARPSPRRLLLTLAGEDEIATKAGVFATRRIDLARVREDGARGAVVMSFWVEKGPRRALVKLEADDGRRLLLTGVTRRDYWSRRKG